MASTTRECPVTESEAARVRAWGRELEPPDVEVIQVIQAVKTAQEEETPTEPGYGHGV
jgi:hypothetical protein